nr:hypothetical protein [Paenibacillus soyae]
MDEQHERAEEARAKLRQLGISEAYSGSDADLRFLYNGSDPFSEDDYNPLEDELAGLKMDEAKLEEVLQPIYPRNREIEFLMQETMKLREGDPEFAEMKEYFRELYDDVYKYAEHKDFEQWFGRLTQTNKVEMNTDSKARYAFAEMAIYIAHPPQRPVPEEWKPRTEVDFTLDYILEHRNEGISEDTEKDVRRWYLKVFEDSDEEDFEIWYARLTGPNDREAELAASEFRQLLALQQAELDAAIAVAASLLSLWALRGRGNPNLGFVAGGGFRGRNSGTNGLNSVKPVPPAKPGVPRGLGTAKPIKEVEIVDKNGRPIGELDEIDLKNGVFYEDKTAKGLNIVNPKTGLPAQTPQQFADKQILEKTRKRIQNLKEAVATRPTKNGSQDVPSLNQIQNIRKFVFRLDGDTPELRQAVENSLNQLRKEFPDHTFEVIFGGKN